MPTPIKQPLQLRQLEFSCTIDSDGEIAVTSDCCYGTVWIDLKEAEELVVHLCNTFGFILPEESIFPSDYEDPEDTTLEETQDE